MLLKKPYPPEQWDVRLEMELDSKIILAILGARVYEKAGKTQGVDDTGYVCGLVTDTTTGRAHSLLKRCTRELTGGKLTDKLEGVRKVVVERIGGVLRIFLKDRVVFEYADPYVGHSEMHPYCGMWLGRGDIVLHRFKLLVRPASVDAGRGFNRFELSFRNIPDQIYEAEFFEQQQNRVHVTKILLHNITDLWKAQQENRKLLEQKEAVLAKIKEELTIAGTVVERLLPRKMPDIAGLRFAYHYKPCDEIGGDLFDVIDLNDGKIVLLMYDVSGHGVSAALISVMTRTLFQKSFVPDEPILPQISDINRELRRYFQTHFVSYFCGILDVKNRRLRYVGGGLPYPAVLAAGRLVLLDTQGTPLGLQQDLSAQEKTMELLPGDKFLLFTDGIYEAFNAEDEMYGRKRLMEFAVKLSDSDIQTMVRAIVREHQNYLNGMPATDDVTLLGIEFESLPGTA
jgi:sigma-B regulation protein RsbU (phosphoserine phosphatase)